MRILMRGAIDPLSDMNPAKFIIENHTGGNIGNMIFTNSIARTLLVDDDTVIDYVDLREQRLDDAYAAYVNETYDCFLIPLANAFKSTNYDELMIITDFVKKLTIPCSIIGVGIQRTISNARFSEVYPHCEEAKAMVAAVLEKSPMIGVRGELTGEFLKDLGFLPEKDFTVIGCPSMFTYGDTLPEIKPTVLRENSVISFNSKVEFEKLDGYQPFVDFAERNMKLFPNMVYVQQQIDDVRMIYLDSIKQDLRSKKSYDISKAISFTNIPAWIDYFRDNVDFSFGSRIHGNVAAILAGVPALAVPFDRRVLELADYHNIPYLKVKPLSKFETLYDVFEQVDFSSVHRGHKERFNHYLDFLHTLGLDTIYDHDYAGEKIPYDKIMDAHKYPGVIKSYDVLTDAEKLERYKDSFQLYREIRKDLASSLKTEQKKVASRDEKIKARDKKLEDRNEKLKQRDEKIRSQKEQIAALKKENETLKAELRVNPLLRIWRGILRRLRRLLHTQDAAK